MNSNYEVRVGRADNITGPFVDQSGKPMLQGGGTHLVGGGNGWAAGGGQSLLRGFPGMPLPNPTPMRQKMVMHAYDGVTGDPWANIVEVDWSGSWPVVVGNPK